MNAFARTLAVALAFAAAGTGCAVLPDSTPEKVYRLPPPTLSAADGQVVNTSLRVATPAASGPLASPSIVVIPQGHRVSGYSDSRWSSAAPVLWRDHLVEAFGEDGRVRRISGDNLDARSAWELGGLLRAFQTEYRDGEPRVIIEYQAHLIDGRNGQIAASREFVVREPIDGTQVPQVVEAFGRAADRTARQVIDWAVIQLR